MKFKRIQKNSLLVDIYHNDRDEIFRTEIVNNSGKQLFLVKHFESFPSEDNFYSQTVNIGKVVEISPDVLNIKVGDTLIFDNLIDSDATIVVEKTQEYKRVLIQANTSFHDEDYYVPPIGRSRGGFVWKKGDIDEISHIICVIRDGEFISTNHKVICKQSTVVNDWKVTGMQIPTNVRPLITTRHVLVAPQESDIEHGDIVLVKDEHIATFDMGGKLFDYFETEDVMIQRSMKV